MTSTVRDVIMWCLIAAVVIVAAAALIATRRQKRTIAVQRSDMTGLQSRLADQEEKFSRAREELRRIEASHSKTITEAAEAAEESTKAVLKGPHGPCRASPPSRGAHGRHPAQVRWSSRPERSARREPRQRADRAQGPGHRRHVRCDPLGRRKEAGDRLRRRAQRPGTDPQLPSGRDHAAERSRAEGAAIAPIALAVAELLDNAASFSSTDAHRGHVPARTPQPVHRHRRRRCRHERRGAAEGDRTAVRAITARACRNWEIRRNSASRSSALLARQYGFRVDVTGTSPVTAVSRRRPAARGAVDRGGDRTGREPSGQRPSQHVRSVRARR